VAKAEAGLHAAEARLAEGEEAEANLQRELRIAELAVFDREELETHNKALLERLEESRSEHGQLANYKQVGYHLLSIRPLGQKNGGMRDAFRGASGRQPFSAANCG